MKPASQWQRVAIIGPSGAGKSTLARRLGSILNLPVIHFDTEFWQPGWKEPPKDQWHAKVRKLARRDRWIIDGNYAATMDERLAFADAIVMLDFSTLRCLWQVIKRVITYRGITRPDLAPGCPEKWDWEFIEWVLTYRREHLPTTLDKLSRVESDKRILIVRNNHEVDALVQAVRDEISAHRC